MSNEICKELEELKFAIQFPKFYLSNYFTNLRYEVDVLFGEKSINSTSDRETINKTWSDIIEKMSLFETYCLKNTRNNFEINFNDIKSKHEIENEFYKFNKCSTVNKTIIFLTMHPKCGDSKLFKNTDYRLVLIGDEHISGIESLNI